MSIRNSVLDTDTTALALLLKERLDYYTSTYTEPEETLSKLVKDSTFRDTLYKLYYDTLQDILEDTEYDVSINFRLQQDTEDNTTVFIVETLIYRKYLEVTELCETSLDDSPIGRTIEKFLEEKGIEYYGELQKLSDEEILEEIAKRKNIDYNTLYNEYEEFLEKLYDECLEEVYKEINNESAIQLDMKIHTPKYTVEAYPVLCHSNYCKVGLEAVIELRVKSPLDFIYEVIELRKIIYTIGLLSTI